MFMTKETFREDTRHPAVAVTATVLYSSASVAALRAASMAAWWATLVVIN